MQWCVPSAAQSAILVHGSANSAPEHAMQYGVFEASKQGLSHPRRPVRLQLRCAMGAKRAETRQIGRFVQFCPFLPLDPSLAVPAGR